MTAIEQARQFLDEAWNSRDQWDRKYDAAEATLQAAIEANPTDPVLLTCLGAVLSDRGQHERAVVFLQKAIDGGSVDRNTYRNLAIALMNGNADARQRARTLFERAQQLRTHPQTWEAYFDPHGH